MSEECFYRLAGLNCGVAKALYFSVAAVLVSLTLFAWLLVFRRVMDLCSRRLLHSCSCSPEPTSHVVSGEFEGIPLDLLAQPSDALDDEALDVVTTALLHPVGVSHPLVPYNVGEQVAVVVEGVVVANITLNASNVTPGAA